MSVAVSIISTIIKSAVNSKVGNELANELIGISVDDVSEKGISKINDFINNGRTKIEKILSKEKMKSIGVSEDNIAYVTAEVKGLFSEIEITDEIFRQCKYDSLNLCNFLWGKYSENKTGYIECEGDIKKSLLAISEALTKIMRESEEFVIDISIQISNTVDDTRIEIQRISDYLKENFSKISTDNQRILDILREILEQNKKDDIKKKSRTQEYLDKWNANMFLNNFDKRDENAGVNVKLREVYLNEHLPHYIWGDNRNKSTDLKELLSEYIEDHNDNKMLLILGQPGIGKSTLITWITANFNEKIDDILVYQFASDLKDIDWQKPDMPKEILNALNLSYNELNGKTLILDGFDEINIETNRRRDILDNLYDEWIYRKNVKNSISLIITCRENYIKGFERAKCNYITLKTWSEKQIRSFCNIFQAKTKNIISVDTIRKLIENKGILGVPLILYMVLALKISIEEEGTIVDIYDKIFSLEGGIYDRCIDNKRFSDSHRISEVKNQIHQISREIAIWMFENKPDEACIPQEEYQKICKDIAKNQLQETGRDFLIGNYFKLVKHCEGIETEELYFVHRSIYEYFVAKTICGSIENHIIDLTEDSQKKFAGSIVVYLKQGQITYTIGLYIKHIIIKLLNTLNKDDTSVCKWIEDIVNEMIFHGMFYYSRFSTWYCRNIIKKELQCFMNLIDILRSLLDISGKKCIMEFTNRSALERYIKYCIIEKGFASEQKKGLDFSYMDLSHLSLAWVHFDRVNLQNTIFYQTTLAGADLEGSYLEGAIFRGSYLHKTNLKRTYLAGADLSCTDLSEANFIKAEIKTTLLGKENVIKLDNAKMESAIFDETQVDILEEKYNLQCIKVFIIETKEYISYEEYCKRKQQENM